MTTQLADSQGKPIQLGDFLDGGGEGAVYRIRGDENRLAKIFAKQGEPLERAVEAARSRRKKFEAMLRSPPAALRTHAAWPESVIYFRGSVCGLVMPYARNCHKLSELYNPRDRLAKYPNADWRLLVVAARNCAAALETLHGAGHVMGDVNQSNIMVAATGNVTLIDCDSFQVRDSNTGEVYRCPVWSREFTPPELQGADFNTVVREPQHDAFGLAALVFHLLFLGRTPFAGVPRHGQDIAVEEAIRRGVFAWSPSGRNGGLQPPPGAVMLSDVGQTVASMLERAFAGPGVPRPRATEWRTALDALLQGLAKCARAEGHVYRAGLSDCPWCRIERESGVAPFASALPASAEFDASGRLRRDLDQLARIASRAIPAAPSNVAATAPANSVASPLRVAVESKKNVPTPPPTPQVLAIPQFIATYPQFEPTPATPENPKLTELPSAPQLRLTHLPPAPTPPDGSASEDELHVPVNDIRPMVAAVPVVVAGAALMIAGAVAPGLVVVTLAVAFLVLRKIIRMGPRRWLAQRRFERAFVAWHEHERRVRDANNEAAATYALAQRRYDERVAAVTAKNDRVLERWHAASAEAAQIRAQIAQRNEDLRRAHQQGESLRRIAWEQQCQRIESANAAEQRRCSAELAKYEQMVVPIRQQNAKVDAARRALREEHARRSALVQQWNEWLTQLISRWQAQVQAVRSVQSAGTDAAAQARTGYGHLDSKFRSALNNADSGARALALRAYLSRYSIAAAGVRGVPSTVVDRLLVVGIRTAADVNTSIKVDGLGDKRRSYLLAWRSDLERSFARSRALSPDAIRLAQQSVHKARTDLGAQIRRASDVIQGAFDLLDSIGEEITAAKRAEQAARNDAALTEELVKRIPPD